jgi:hypothetical protein
MTWFVSTSDIIGLIAGWTTLRIVERFTVKINAAHWGIFIVFVVSLWTVEGLALAWWFSGS